MFIKFWKKNRNGWLQVWKKVCKDAKVPAYHTRIGSMLCTFLPITRLRIMLRPKMRYKEVCKILSWYARKRGFIFAPSQFEAVFVSAVHGEKEIDSTIEAFKEVIKGLCEAKHSPAYLI